MLIWFKNNKALSLMILAGIGFLAYYLFYALRWIMYPNSTDYGEGFVMDYAKLWANGNWSWDVNTPPYLTMVYGLGFPMLVAPFIKIFGAELWIGRGISFISALITCLLIYLIVKSLTGKKSYGLLAALLPMTQFIFRDWSIMARVDMPAVMFDVLGLYLVIKYKDSKLLYLAIIPFIIALMIKITAVAGLAAVLIYLLIYNRKKLLAFTGLLAIGIAVVIIPLMLVSGGAYLKEVILYENTINYINIANMTYILSMFLFAGVVLIVPSIIYLMNMGKKITLAGLFLIIAFIIAMVGTLRLGSAENYYFETIVAGSICATLALPTIINYFRANVKRIMVALVCLVVAFLLCYAPRVNYQIPNEQYSVSAETVQNIMADSNKPIITELSQVVFNMGRDLYIEPFVFTNMTLLGYWDETNYVNGYKNGDYDYVLLRGSLVERLDNMRNGITDVYFSNAVINAMNDNYILVWSNDMQYPYSLYLYEFVEGMEIN
jgi:hypothetical protein